MFHLLGDGNLGASSKRDARATGGTHVRRLFACDASDYSEDYGRLRDNGMVFSEILDSGGGCRVTAGTFQRGELIFPEESQCRQLPSNLYQLQMPGTQGEVNLSMRVPPSPGGTIHGGES
jgi:hypothetical protein